MKSKRMDRSKARAVLAELIFWTAHFGNASDLVDPDTTQFKFTTETRGG
jgi:hypothetical protein